MVYRKNTTPASTSRIHRRSMTHSSSLSPPSKRVKGQSISSKSKRADVTSGNEQEITTNETKGGWGNFAARIAQDDKNMVLKARDDQKRLGGETFRPELRETYKGLRGKKETIVHDKVGSNRCENMATGLDVAEGEEKEGNGGAVVVDRAYETDSSDGGIALSPSDVETDSWVAIKTGDENRGWERK